MIMDVSITGWKDFFMKWPSELPKRGVLVTEFNEQISFSGFMASEAFLLIQRKSPDSLGARMVLLPYEQISAMKIIDVIKAKAFKAMGFQGSLAEG